MKCSNCKGKNTRVTCTIHRSAYTVRYCRCLDCKHKFKTEERIVKYELTHKRNSKLNEKKVKQIRKAAEKAKQEGEKITHTTAYLAADYNVDFSTIKAVLSHRTWADVETEHEPEVIESMHRYNIKYPVDCVLK